MDRNVCACNANWFRSAKARPLTVDEVTFVGRPESFEIEGSDRSYFGEDSVSIFGTYLSDA